MFAKVGVVGWDDNPANVLIDEHNIPKLCDFNQLRIANQDVVPNYVRAINSLVYIYEDTIRAEERMFDDPNYQKPASQTRIILQELRSWLKNEHNERSEFLTRDLLNQKLKKELVRFEQRKCVINCLSEHISYPLSEISEQCETNCQSVQVEVDPHYLDFTQKQQNQANLVSAPESAPDVQSQANGAKPASAQTFFGIPMANAEVIRESPTPLPFLFFKNKPIKHKRSRFNIRPLPLDNKEIQDFRMNFDPIATGKCGSGKKTLITNTETGATVVKMEGNVSHSIESGKSLIFVGPNSKVKISGLKSRDQIRLPASEYHDGLPRCQNTSSGSILTSGSKNIVIETDASCDSVMTGITPLSEESQLDSINAVMEFIKTPFFHSSLFCHGLAFVAAFREEIADKLMWQFAKGDEQRYNSWQKALTEFRAKSSIKLVSDLSDMALRVVVSKDLQVTENTTHIAKDFMQALISTKNEPRIYLGILARVFDEAALLLDKAIPYVSIGGLTQILTRTYDQYVASGSKAKAAHTLIDNLPLLIPGSRVLLDSLEDQERHLRKISNQPDGERISTEHTNASCGLRRRVKHN